MRLRPSPHQLRNRLAITHQRRGAAVEVVDGDFEGVNAEVLVDGGEEVAGAAGALNDVFAAFVAGADDAAGLDAAAGPDIRKGAGPVVAAGLDGAGGGAGVAGTGAAVEADLGRAAELAGDDDEDAPIEAAGVDVLDE